MKKVSRWLVFALVMVLVGASCVVQEYVNIRGAMAIWSEFNQGEDDINVKEQTVHVKKRTIGEEGTVKIAPCNPEELLDADFAVPAGILDPTEFEDAHPATLISFGKATMVNYYNHEPVEQLKAATPYTLVLTDLPGGFMGTHDEKVGVVYPADLVAGETGEFQVWMKVNGKYYYNTFSMKAKDDVNLVHGSHYAEAYSGGEFSYDANSQTLEVNFYTSAVSKHLERPRSAGRYSSYGHLDVNFTRVLEVQ